jgi:hypothetical protein
MKRDKAKQKLEQGLQTIQQIFECRQALTLPKISVVKNESVTIYDHDLREILLGADMHRSGRFSESDRVFCQGQALSCFAHQQVNPEIYRKVYVEGTQLYEEAKKDLLNIKWDLVKQDYVCLDIILAGVVPTCAGFIFTERRAGKEAAMSIFQKFVNRLAPYRLMQALFDGGKGIPNAKLAASQEMQQCRGISAALNWYHQKPDLLPKLARVNTAEGYNLLAKESGIPSELISLQ